MELNRSFPSVLRAQGDWRSFLSESDELGPQVNSASLIAFITKHSLAEIDGALSDAQRRIFVRDVLHFEVSRRLGLLDFLVSLSDSRESRLPPEWKHGLQLAADHYLSQAPPGLDQALELAEVLRGLRHFHPAHLPLMQPLRAALRSEDELVRSEALDLLRVQRQVPWERLWPEFQPLFRSGRRTDGVFGLELLRVATGELQYLRGRVADQVTERVLHALARASERQLDAVPAAARASPGERQDVLALLVSALGLASEVIPLLFEPQKQRHRQEGALLFLGELGEAGAEAVPRLLERLAEPASGDRLFHFRILGQVGAGDPQILAYLQERLVDGDFTDRQASFATLLKLHWKERLEWSEALAHRGLSVLRDALERRQHTWLITTLDGFPPDWRRRVLPGLEELERELLERLAQQDGALEKLASLGSETLGRLLKAAPSLSARFLNHARAHPDDRGTDAFLETVGPETPAALLLIQHRLRERDGHPWNRQQSVRLLGRFVGEHPSPAEAILLGIFLDGSEDVTTRVEAARVLSLAAGRLESAPLVSALEDESAVIRGWAYLLLGEGRAVRTPQVARDPSPAVRHLAAGPA